MQNRENLNSNYSEFLLIQRNGHNGFREKGLFINYFKYYIYKKIYFMYGKETSYLDVSSTHTQHMFDRRILVVNTFVDGVYSNVYLPII